VKASRKRNTQRGTTLVETLVALVVLSVGLLGIAALQIASLSDNRGAHMRSQASVLAYDIADRMRANRASAMANGYQIAFTATPAAADTSLTATDIRQWKSTLGQILPGGDGEIMPDNGMFRISVRWTDSSQVQQTFVTRTRI
jgi:type IV pilus assembly protein PilV